MLQSHHFFIGQYITQWLITAAIKSIGNRRTNRKTAKTRKQNWKRNSFVDILKQWPGKILQEKTWTWLLKRSYLTDFLPSRYLIQGCFIMKSHTQIVTDEQLIPKMLGPVGISLLGCHRHWAINSTQEAGMTWRGRLRDQVINLQLPTWHECQVGLPWNLKRETESLLIAA